MHPSKIEQRFHAFVRTLPCLICYREFWQLLMAHSPDVQFDLAVAIDALGERAGGIQKTPTEVAHLGRSDSRRGLSQKYGAWEVGPLCNAHHQTAPDSHHKGTRTFWEQHPWIERDAFQDMLVRIFERE